MRMDTGIAPIRWQGGHHLAVVTRDLDATIRFYHGLLSMELLAAMAPMPYHGRHCFLRAGTFLMHFFEDDDARIDAPPPGWERQVIAFVSGAMQHIALAMDDEAGLLALRERLQAAGVPVTALMDQGPVRQFLFADNNGIIIEANWTPEELDLAKMKVDYRHPFLFGDPDPVPAVRELQATGRLRQ
jgi:catechol 2,3-dioxygenase-like lactoylglutathione lyase family enzyme